jgi:tellurite resistance protein TerC
MNAFSREHTSTLETMVSAGPVEWLVFGTAMGGLLLIDVAYAGRDRRHSTLRSAALWSAIWIGAGLLFGAWVWMRFGTDAGLAYLTAYLLEKSLSVDNLFVFILIFSGVGLPAPLQHRALFWGVAGALVMRAVFIVLGIYLLERFHWMIYPFGALLFFSAIRLLWGEERREQRVENGCAICTSWIARFIPIAPVPDSPRFLVREQGRLKATPLLVALVMIEATDLMFAVDSIPAVLAVTRDPFLAYTSNVFAVLGLRSLYLLLAGVMQRLRFLRTGLAALLLFAATKMLLSGVITISPGTSLGIVVGIFTASILTSWLFPRHPASSAST